MLILYRSEKIPCIYGRNALITLLASWYGVFFFHFFSWNLLCMYGVLEATTHPLLPTAFYYMLWTKPWSISGG